MSTPLEEETRDTPGDVGVEETTSTTNMTPTTIMSPMRLALPTRLAVSTILAGTMVLAPAAAAQDTILLRLIGEARDFTTEQPILGIAVKLVELGEIRVTDRNGFFAFDSVPVGEWTFEASGFGYVTNVEASHITENSALLIRLETAPIELEGLYVSVVQRLVRRRMATPSRVVAWDNVALNEAISADVGAFVKKSGAAVFVPCGGEWSAVELPNCFMLRGRLARLTLFVDDIKQIGAAGTSGLWAHDPHNLWAVEFLPECRQLRVYTEHYMRMVEEGRVRLDPVIFCE